jgi:hypothetical protein
VVNRQRHCMLQLKSKSLHETAAADAPDDDDADDSKKEKNEDNDYGVDNIMPIDEESEGAIKRNKKLIFALDTSKKLWQIVVHLLECNYMGGIVELTLCASASIPLFECSSSSHGGKHIFSWVVGLKHILRKVKKMTF